MENINHFAFSPMPTSTVPIIHPNPTSSTVEDYEHLMRSTTPTPLQLKHRAKRAEKEYSKEYKAAQEKCIYVGYNIGAQDKPNGGHDYICLPDALRNQTSLLSVSEAISLCSYVGGELTRLKLTTKPADVKRYKEYCTNSFGNIIVSGNKTEISTLREFLNTNEDLDGISLGIVRTFLSNKDKNEAKKAEGIKRNSSVVYSVSSRLFGRFHSVLAFCALSLYTAYIRNYSY